MQVKDLQPGMKVWRFRLQRSLTRGGMGSVWAAWDERLDREVALKLLPRILLTEPSAEARFEREARAMARLQHPNVVAIFDVGTADPGIGEELPYLVMELIRGHSLNEMLADGPLPPRLAARILEQVALALAAAHKVGVIHRDLKPSNIMVGDGGHVTVLDFGLARLVHREGETPVETLTSPGMVLGSCPYMAPEQALGQEVTPASDIFSCGAVLYETLAGRRAFDAPTPMKVLQDVSRSEYPRLHDVAPNTPSDLVAVVDRCLMKDPARRYRTCTDLARDMAIFQGTDEVSLVEVPTVSMSTGRLQAVTARRRRAAVRNSVIAAATIVAGLALGFLSGRHSTEPLRPDPGRWEARVLMDTVGTLSDPSWNLDGSEVVVARNRIGTGEIVAVDARNGKARSLLAAGPPEALSGARVSPDGKAVLVEVVVAGESSLRVFPFVGGPPTIEIASAGGGTWLDADSFLFAREETAGGFGVYRYSLKTRETTRMRQADGPWLRAEPRPGGGFALLAGPSGIPNSVMVLDALGGSPQVWQPPGNRVYGASWSPSRRSLVGSIDGRLVRITADGATPLVPRIDRLWYPSFAPGGDRLAAVRRTSTNDLIAVDPDGGGWSCLLCGVADSGWGSVDSAGNVVYRRYLAGSATIFLREPSGLEVAVTDPSEDASCPVVSPEGDRIAYLARVVDSGTELRVVSRQGGPPVTLAAGVEPSEYPSWSPDGRSIAFAAGSPISVRVVSASGGEPRALTHGGDYPAWSPDGRFIAYSVWTQDSDPDQGAWIVELDGGAPQKIGDEPTRLVWSRDGRALWQLRRAGDRVELWEVLPENWEWQRKSVLELGRPAASHLEHLPLTVSPATGELVMNRRSDLASLLVFEGLDPRRW